MGHPLIEIRRVGEPASAFIKSAGSVFAEFGGDSGNVAFGVEQGGRKVFAKTAGTDVADRELTLGLLRNAVEVARSVTHHALPDLLNVVEAPDAPILVYEWVSGELLRRDEPGDPHNRFRALPLDRLLAAVDTIFDVLHTVARAGWITEDVYDGAFLYDFDTHDLHVVDLDHSHRGPFTNTMGRMYGSTRFMAPEEFVKGATIDHRTATFLMGRILSVFLSDASLDREPFRGTDAQYDVMIRACQPDPDDRYQAEDAFLDAWRIARG